MLRLLLLKFILLNVNKRKGVKMEATAKDLRFHSKELLESVEQGEEVIITYHGKPKAKLVPIDEKKLMAVKEESPIFGIWKDNPAVEGVDEYVRGLRKGRYS